MKLSVLIRNLNEVSTLKQTLCALKKQQTSFEYEVVMIDNESDDNSVEVAAQMGCKIFTLKRNEFTFGKALNFGIEKCKGEFILILSAHVVLLNEFFLENIPKYFSNHKVAGLRFVQGISGEETVNSLQNGVQELYYSASLNFLNDNWKNFIVNHCSAIKRTCWNEVSFNEQTFASEDKIWSLEILKKGYSILYNVPGFYLYIKPFNMAAKNKREVIEIAAKELITGKPQPFFAGSYIQARIQKIIAGFKRFISELKNHKRVYKGVQEYKRKYKRI